MADGLNTVDPEKDIAHVLLDALAALGKDLDTTKPWTGYEGYPGTEESYRAAFNLADELFAAVLERNDRAAALVAFINTHDRQEG